MEPLRANIPYPSLDNITRDLRSAYIIAPAYAGLHSEATAILQYTYHHFWFDALKNEAYATKLEEISLAEMMHFDLLGKTLLKLGLDPVYATENRQKTVWFNTSTVAYSKTPKKMLMDDISGEMGAIADYQRILASLNNENAAAIIQRIIFDETLHLETLKEMLASLS